MRGLATIVLAAVIGGFVAGAVQLQMAISLRSGEEFIIAIVLLAGAVILTAVLFAIVLALGGGRRGITRTAFGVFAVLVLVLVAFEYVGEQVPARMPSRTDLVLIAEILFPALIAIAIEWWLVQRHLKKAAAVARAVGQRSEPLHG